MSASRSRSSSLSIPIAVVATRRLSSTSYLEIALYVDVVTGGAFGPRNATFSTKTALTKYALHELLKHVKTYDGKEECEGKKLLA